MDLKTAIENKDSIINKYKENKPNLSDASIKTYISMLITMYRKIINDNSGKIPHFTWFVDNIHTILEHLKDYHPSKRKTLLSAIITMGILDDEYTKELKKIMNEDMLVVKTFYQSQEKTSTQAENWITQDEIKKIYLGLENDAKYYFQKAKKFPLSPQEKNQLQKYIILSLFVLLIPRRVQDYIFFKIRNVDKTKDNYKEGLWFYFNKYKTAKTYGTQRIQIGNKLNNIYNRWLSINDTDYLLYDFAKNEPLSASRFVYIMNNIFGNKKISVNILRHSYLTEKLSGIPEIKALKELQYQMGHNLENQLEYIKK